MSSVRLSDTWRTTTFRLVVLYGSMFAFGVVSLLALIYLDTADYFDHQTALILKAELHNYQSIPAANIPKSFATDIARDSRHISIYGLFSPQGKPIAGNISHFPANMPMDENSRLITTKRSLFWSTSSESMWGAAAKLPDQNILFVGRRTIQLEEIRRVIFKALGGAVIVILIGTFLGIKLSIRPIRRIRETQEVSQKIINGDISLRLPTAGTDDELDMLAIIVNKMLDEIAQRMRDIKGSTDSIAHDLRTPLTHLRAMLNRLLHSPSNQIDRQAIEQAIEEADILLFRFRAILRISEISGSMRTAMFENVDLKQLLENIQDVYAPLAEEKEIDLKFDLDVPAPIITGDNALLFEAILNLVDNAVKFAPSGGYVHVRLVPHGQGFSIEIENNGPGIPEDELHMVFQPFYRSSTTRHLSNGHGVGLSIVAAIMNLHGFRLTLTSHDGITRVLLETNT